MERNIKLLALFNFFTDFKFHSAILILYFSRVTGSFALGMSLFSVTQIISAIFEVPTGIYSDYLGRKKTLLLGAVCASLSAILYAVGINYWFLFLGAIAEGLSRSWYSGNNDALLHDSLRSLGRKDLFDHYFGRVSAMFQVALTVGAVMGSVMAFWSFALVMWLSVIPQLTCCLIGLFIREPPVESREIGNVFTHLRAAAAFLWKNKLLRLLSLQDILAYGVNEATFQFRAAFIATLWPLWAIGFAKMLSYAGASLSYWFGSRIIRRVGALKMLFLSRVYGRVVNFVSLLFPTIISPILMSTTSVFFGVTNVATTSLMQKEFTNEQRATIASLNSFVGSMLFSFFALALGLLADKTNPTQALIVAEVCTIPLIYLTGRLFYAGRQEL